MNPSLYDMLMALAELQTYAELSEWEDNFITSIVGQVERGGNSTVGLTGKQADKIEQLYEKRIVRGH